MKGVLFKLTLFYLILRDSIDYLFDALTRDGPDEFKTYPVPFDIGVYYVLLSFIALTLSVASFYFSFY